MNKETNTQNNVNIFTGLFDWWDKKSGDSKVLVILILLMAFLGWQYWEREKQDAELLAGLRMEVDACKDLKKEVEEYKLQAILIQAGDDQSPNAQWRTAAGTNKVLWCNLAYEAKYLTPKGFSRKDLLGTDGSHIFGEEAAKLFGFTNNRVVRTGQPIVENEIIKTLKFPIFIGGYIYAVGGMEYEENFNFKRGR